MNIGAVAALRNIKDAIAVARNVLQNSRHTMLVGDQATEFAVQMGYEKESLRTNYSQQVWQNWKNSSCQPNFWIVSALCRITLMFSWYSLTHMLTAADGINVHHLKLVAKNTNVNKHTIKQIDSD